MFFFLFVGFYETFSHFIFRMMAYINGIADTK